MWGVSQAALRRFHPLRPSLWRLLLPPVSPMPSSQVASCAGLSDRAPKLSSKEIFWCISGRKSLNWEFRSACDMISFSPKGTRLLIIVTTPTSGSEAKPLCGETYGHVSLSAETESHNMFIGFPGKIVTVTEPSQHHTEPSGRWQRLYSLTCCVFLLVVVFSDFLLFVFCDFLLCFLTFIVSPNFLLYFLTSCCDLRPLVSVAQTVKETSVKKCVILKSSYV